MAKKILLSSAILDSEDMFGQFGKGGGAYLPHGLLSIAAVLLKHGHDVSICDPYVMGMGLDDFSRYLERNRFDIIGLGNCYTSYTKNYFTIANACRKALPSAVICIGGAHLSLFPKETLERCPDIDFAIMGEGEFPLLNLIRELEANEPDLSMVEGLVYRKNGGILINRPHPGVQDIDNIPIFPYHLLPMEKYIPPPSNYKTLPTYGMLIQKGCPYQCIFCDSRIHGRKLRQMSVDRAINEIRFLIDNYGMKGVVFHDSIFTINRQWVVEFCTKLIEQELKLAWTCFTRADAVDDELCFLMKKAGCWSIAFGIESANQESLDLVKKSIKVERIRQGIRSVKKAGLEMISSIILCLPGEDEQMVRKTIKFVKDMDLDIVVFYLPVPFPGTELYEMCKREGGLAENIAWEDYRQWMDQRNPLYINPKIGKEKMVELYQYAFRAFYLSPKYIWKIFRKIRTVDD
ncbi:MAG: radical SAM protein, partial [Candidatus Omnitrophica bacterium]|nr:radical SAM protein [Candidatus Omnitrophota bacterium]